jgi:hypothetical protein
MEMPVKPPTLAARLNSLRTRLGFGNRSPSVADNRSPSAADSSGIAVDAIRAIYDVWGVEADRVQWIGDTSASTILREGYGFDWWPGDFKVCVRVHGPHPELDYPLYRLSVQTDFLCNVDVTTPKFKKNISDLNRNALTFTVCAHPGALAQISEQYGSAGESGLDLKSSEVWLGSTAYVHEESKDWLPRLFSGFAIMQPIEAQFRADLATLLLGGKANRSSPSGGVWTTNLDDILGVDQFVAHHGQQPSKWIHTEEFEQIVDRWGRSDSGFGTAGKGWLTIETPFGAATAILKLKTDEPHPRLGNGLLITLTLPGLYEDEGRMADLAIEMNFMEITRWLKVGVPLIGNWSAERWNLPAGPRFATAFSCFVPNMMYKPGLAENFVLYAMGRAKWFRERYLPDATDLPMHEILNKRLNLK